MAQVCSFAQGWVKDIEAGDALLKQRRYAEALELFQEALYKNPEAQVERQMVQCHKTLEDWYQLAHWTHQLYRNDPSKPNLLEAARSFKKIGEYKKAKILYKKYLKLEGNDHVQIELAGCDSAVNWRDEYLGPRPRNLKRVNTKWSESAPVVYNDQLVFISNREGTIIRTKNNLNALPYYDLYKTPIKESGRSKRPVIFDRFLASRSHFGPACFAPDGNTMYFTKSKSPGGKSGPSSLPKLYMTSQEAGKWQEPLKFVMNDSSYVFGHPIISSDGKIFLFSSNMEGGYGGLDIYLCIEIDGSWSDPINLGPEVNTPGNEISPFLNGKTQLFFSSDYHLGMGGYDVFTAVLKSGGKFSDVRNTGPMVNSSFDEVSYFQTGSEAYFSSNRQGGMGKEDIYVLKLPKL